MLLSIATPEVLTLDCHYGQLIILWGHELALGQFLPELALVQFWPEPPPFVVLPELTLVQLRPDLALAHLSTFFS